MLTPEDFKNLTKLFVTKDDLAREIGTTKAEMHALHREVMGKFDSLFGELKVIREERIIHMAPHDRIDKRLDKLEDAVFKTKH